MYSELSFLELLKGCFMEQLVTESTRGCCPWLHLLQHTASALNLSQIPAHWRPVGTWMTHLPKVEGVERGLDTFQVQGGESWCACGASSKQLLLRRVSGWAHLHSRVWGQETPYQADVGLKRSTQKGLPALTAAHKSTGSRSSQPVEPGLTILPPQQQEAGRVTT